MGLIKLLLHLGYIFVGHHVIDATPETQWYQEPVVSLLSTEEYVSETLASGGWLCKCGRANYPYVSTCTCGQNKKGCLSDHIEARQQQQQLHDKELQNQIHKIQLLHEANFITNEEYEAEMVRLTRFGIKK